MIKKILIFGLLLLLLVLGSLYMINKKINSENSIEQEKSGLVLNTLSAENSDANFEQAFINENLFTNTSIKSIELDQVLGGGPGKDGIPSIDNPKFISVSDAQQIENSDHLGIVLQIGETTRFYSYSILVWHEIVNDEIEGQPVLVTFCPLCGSAIVFDPKVNKGYREFGVSGKLWESNLLMFDRVNESLWSQSKGEAVVGSDTGNKLGIIPSQLITFGEFSEKYPDGQVLSRDTGHFRSYGFYPYGDYENTEETIFPVSVQDNRLPSKEIMYAVNFEDKGIAFKRESLIEVGSAEIIVGGKKIVAKVSGSEITVTDESGNIIPGYHEMWFSWATHHQENGVVWVE